MSHISSLFGALSDPHRLTIVEALMRNGEATAGEICEMFDISAPAVSRHLAVLYKSGLVDRRVAGKHRIYSVRPTAIRRVVDWTSDHRGFWEASLDRIEAALKEDSP